jgi:DNA-binding Lrp family transcriptional regulator
MKLSSPPTRYAFTSVIAAAMKYGPTRVSRIAYELDMPVETCRYYLKRFHNTGFRFLPVVDYKALGLQPCILFIRLSKRLDTDKRENLLRWLDTLYTVYRASLDSEYEYYIESVPPLNDVKLLEQMMNRLLEVGILENFSLTQVKNGFYKTEWIKMYDFSQDRWECEIEMETPNIPFSLDKASSFDKLDLLIIGELEKDPTVKMMKISQVCGTSPQLISYHREKHVEADRLILGYIPTRRTKHNDTSIYLMYKYKIEHDEFLRFLHKLSVVEPYNIIRIHAPTNYKLKPQGVVYSIDPMRVKTFTIPKEHFIDKSWIRLENFTELLEKMIEMIVF